MPFCPHCGAEVGPQDTFCKSCGKSLASPSTQSYNAPNAQIPEHERSSHPNSPSLNYCQECGSLNPIGVMYCQNCGSNRMGPNPPMRIERPTGVLVIGIIQIVFAIIDIAAGAVAAGVLAIIGLGILSPIFLIAGILAMVFAIAFLTGRNWGRILMMIGAIIELFAIPIGTIIGIIVLWYLTRPRVKAYFKQPRGKKAGPTSS